MLVVAAPATVASESLLGPVASSYSLRENSSRWFDSDSEDYENWDAIRSPNAIKSNTSPSSPLLQPHCLPHRPTRKTLTQSLEESKNPPRTDQQSLRANTRSRWTSGAWKSSKEMKPNPALKNPRKPREPTGESKCPRFWRGWILDEVPAMAEHRLNALQPRGRWHCCRCRLRRLLGGGPASSISVSEGRARASISPTSEPKNRKP